MTPEELNKIAEERYPDMEAMSSLFGIPDSRRLAFKSGYHLRDAEVEELKAEVERLRKALKKVDECCNDYILSETINEALNYKP